MPDSLCEAFLCQFCLCCLYYKELGLQPANMTSQMALRPPLPTPGAPVAQAIPRV